MTRVEQSRLALGVFLIFGTFGPASMLASPFPKAGSWMLLLVTTVLSGGLSASIIFALRKPWLIGPVVLLFMVALSKPEEIAGYLSGKDEHLVDKIDSPLTMSPAEFDAMKVHQAELYGICSGMIGLGWTVLVFVLNGEGKKRGRLEAEMKLARGIQQSLLPQSGLQLAWCRATGMTVPASEVGGDYYDLVQLPGDSLAVIIADVSGHGVGAGIVAAMAKSAFYSQLNADPSPAAVLRNLNETLGQMIDEKTFVTCAYALLNRADRTVHVATAGHPPVLSMEKASRTITAHRTANVGLGIRRGMEFKEESFVFSPGDLLVFYTDGIIEAAKRNGEQFGIERVQEAMRNGAADLCPRMIHTAQIFSGAKEFRDDATIVCVEAI